LEYFPDTMPYSEEDKIRRILFCGSVNSVLKLPVVGIEASPDFGAIVTSLAAQPGKSHLPLQLCLAANKEGVLVEKRALLLVINQCLKIDCVATKTAVYNSLNKIINTSEDLFDFIFYHRRVFRKRPRGMGAGMRRFLKKWYLSQDPYDLALEVCRVRGRHHWSHKDIIILAKVATKDPALSSVLKAVVKSLDKARDEYGDKPEAQPVLEYLACVQQIKRCGQSDQEAAVRLIDKHSFDIDILPSELLSQPRVWEHAVHRLPMTRVLDHLKTMARKGYLSSQSHPVLNQVLQCIRDPLALTASRLQPAEILSVLARVESSFAEPPAARKENNQNIRIPAPHPSLVEGLSRMMNNSFNNVPKTIGTPHKILVCIDCRPGLFEHGCWGSWSLKCSKAAAVTILSLKASGADMTLITMESDNKVTRIPVDDEDSVSSLVEKWRIVLEPRVVDPSYILSWSREENEKFSSIVIITDSHTHLEKERVWRELETYRNINSQTVRMTFIALACKELCLADQTDPGMLDIAGWGPDLVRVLLAFVRECF